MGRNAAGADAITDCDTLVSDVANKDDDTGDCDVVDSTWDEVEGVTVGSDMVANGIDVFEPADDVGEDTTERCDAKDLGTDIPDADDENDVDG